jgi:heme iron utilization protein
VGGSGSAGRPAGPGAAGASPDDAGAARALFGRERFGALATLAREPAGYPFASVVAYAMGPDGQPLFLFSQLAEHTRNLAADARASLLVCEGPPSGKSVSPLALPRVTLVGDVAPVEKKAVDGAREAYLRVHPEAEHYLALDFTFYRLAVRGARYIGGFGSMAWLTAADLVVPAAGS